MHGTGRFGHDQPLGAGGARRLHSAEMSVNRCSHVQRDREDVVVLDLPRRIDALVGVA